MQKSDSQKAQNVRRKTQASTTLNRKYVKRPVSDMVTSTTVQRSPRISHFNRPKVNINVKTAEEEQIAQPAPCQLQATAIAKMQARKTTNVQTVKTRKLSAKELKDQAIKKALATADTIQQSSTKNKKKRANKIHFGFGRIVLALACTTVAVCAIVYFVNLNMPDISLRVAAMQTGIDASYPSYVPRGFSISSITSENGKITMEFTNSETGDAFTLIEEKSSWDSNALLSNYITPEYKENYTVVREQGLSIYVSGSNAAWVNGGMVFKLVTKSGALTNKQIRAIAVSL